MTDRESELLDRWRAEAPAYHAWGNLIATTLTQSVGHAIQPQSVDLYFRIPIKTRLKSEQSMLAKAFYRGKPYENPYEEIEDKVGLRIVVLFSEEIRQVEQIVNDCPLWVATKARDFEDERLSRPFEFDYQSVHYVVKSKSDLIHDRVTIAKNTPCEIQIRTILQHAYSELTHDTIYKPNVQAEPEVKRAAAKSMALIEATDDYFTQVRERLDRAQLPGKRVSAIVDRAYRTLTGLVPDAAPLNTLIIDHYKGWAGGNFESELESFINEKAFLADFIRQRAPANLLYRQPGILLVYWVIKQAPRAAREGSPLSSVELAPLFSDLGERMPDARL